MKRIIYIILTFLGAHTSWAQTELFVVDFEVDGVGYTSNEMIISPDTYWGRFDGSNQGSTHNFGGTLSGYQGSYYFAGADIDGAASPEGEIVIDNIDIASESGVELQLLMAGLYLQTLLLLQTLMLKLH